ncbi:MAG: hypothetical protein IPN63_00205 [Gammaproteobacteria bacterium]|nr:hypothetical protein [Gammaproteobacteria bacterium]
MKTLVLTRAEPDAVGMSPLGGLLCPAGFADDWGVRVDFCGHDEGGQLLRAPVSPGLFRSAHVRGATRLPLGTPTFVEGPGILAFDGDRERALAPGQRATLTVTRTGPRVIDPRAVLRLAAEQGLMFELPHWIDPPRRRYRRRLLLESARRPGFPETPADELFPDDRIGMAAPSRDASRRIRPAYCTASAQLHGTSLTERSPWRAYSSNRH